MNDKQKLKAQITTELTELNRYRAQQEKEQAHFAGSTNGLLTLNRIDTLLDTLNYIKNVLEYCPANARKKN